MSKCPYCYDGASVAPTSAQRPRPETHELRQCAVCNDFYIRHANGNCFPLLDKNDMDSDAVRRTK